MKKENGQKQFMCSRFGFDFKIIINGTTTTAIILDYNGTDEWLERTYVGVAKLDPKDTYDFKTGKLIAMKLAIAKYHSDTFGQKLKALYGFQRRMIEANERLSIELDTRLNELNPEIP